jgi:hypothetical protein
MNEKNRLFENIIIFIYCINHNDIGIKKIQYERDHV